MSSPTPPSPSMMPEPTPGMIPEPEPMTPMASPAQAVTKKTLSIIALVLTALASVLIVASTWLALRGLTPESVTQMGFDELMAAAESADAIRLGALGIASLINLAALILAVIALIKERPKTMGIIALVTTLILPGIATFASSKMMQAALDALSASIGL